MEWLVYNVGSVEKTITCLQKSSWERSKVVLIKVWSSIRPYNGRPSGMWDHYEIIPGLTTCNRRRRMRLEKAMLLGVECRHW
jgi:hypothetical protein